MFDVKEEYGFTAYYLGGENDVKIKVYFDTFNPSLKVLDNNSNDWEKAKDDHPRAKEVSRILTQLSGVAGVRMDDTVKQKLSTLNKKEKVTKSDYSVQKTPEQIETKISVPVVFGGKEIILNGGSKEFSQFIRNNFYFPDHVLVEGRRENSYLSGFSSNREIMESEYKISIGYQISGENIKIIHNRDTFNPSFTFAEDYSNYKKGESIFEYPEFAKKFFGEILSENNPNQFYLSRFDKGSPVKTEQQIFVPNPELSQEENNTLKNKMFLNNYTEISQKIAPTIEAIMSRGYQYQPNSPFVITKANPENQWLNSGFLAFFTIKGEGGSYGIMRTKAGNYDVYPANYYNDPGSRSHGKIEYVGKGESIFPTDTDNIRFRKFAAQILEEGFAKG